MGILADLADQLTEPIPTAPRPETGTAGRRFHLVGGYRDPDGMTERTRWQRFFAPGTDSTWLMLGGYLLFMSLMIFGWFHRLGWLQESWWSAIIMVGAALVILGCISRALIVVGLKSGLPPNARRHDRLRQR